LFGTIQSILQADEQQAEGDAEVIKYKNWLKEKIN
jgi:hypothetical protein